MPVTSPYDAWMARLLASVLAGPSRNAMPAPAMTMAHRRQCDVLANRSRARAHAPIDVGHADP
jgi:hypothetical protein